MVILGIVIILCRCVVWFIPNYLRGLMQYSKMHVVRFTADGHVSQSSIETNFNAEKEAIDGFYDTLVKVVSIVVIGLVGYALKQNPTDLIPK